MTDTMKHFEQQTSSILCSVLYLHPKASSIFQSCDLLKSDTYAAQKKKKKKKKKKTLKKKKKKKTALRSGLPICHEL